MDYRPRRSAGACCCRPPRLSPWLSPTTDFWDTQASSSEPAGQHRPAPRDPCLRSPTASLRILFTPKISAGRSSDIRRPIIVPLAVGRNVERSKVLLSPSRSTSMRRESPSPEGCRQTAIHAPDGGIGAEQTRSCAWAGTPKPDNPLLVQYRASPHSFRAPLKRRAVAAQIRRVLSPNSEDSPI